MAKAISSNIVLPDNIGGSSTSPQKSLDMDDTVKRDFVSIDLKK